MRRTVLVALSLVLAISGAQARGPYGSLNVGNWKGGAFTNDTNGEFTSCMALAPYKSGITVFVIVGANMSWKLGFASESWNLNSGQNFPIVLTFDGQQPFNVQAAVISKNLLAVDMPDNSALIAQFRKSKAMSAFAQGQLFQFAMTGTSVLLPTLVNCVSKVKEVGVGNVGEFVAVAPKPAAKAVVASAEESAPPAQAAPKTGTQTGTGFVISNNGHIVTNQHVVDGCVGDIMGNLSGDAPVKLRLVSSDETNDLALLQAPSPFKDVATIRDKAIRPGDSVTAIGYPFHGLLTSDLTVTTGIVSSLSGVLNDTRYLQISAAVQPGNSGGPLLDNAGQVVGMVAAKLNALKFAKATGNIPENINFAIKTGMLRDFLDNSVVSYQTADAKSELKTSDIARNARTFTLLISCTAEQSASAKKH
ncbi:serine protease [Bradyrhizobium sp. dw_411]|uniref:S1C family serine protease n=1 Tax=Bradyrhizobium sp. dw_411 TaxID=2720082 RepID=UPI001BD0DB47|nr:serine protease [Bradyrhizobium sp. dw_411]